MLATAFIPPLPTPRRRTRPRLLVACATSPPPSVSSPTTASVRPLPSETPPIIFVLGGPGSGKGTQCKLLQKRFRLAQLCVGDLLRREAANDTDVGRNVAEIMQRGDIVPGHVTMSLLSRELSLLAGQCVAVLIDGFPRAMDQALQFEQLVATCEFVLYFKCDPSVMVERLRRRAQTSGRADDVEHVFRKRLDTFYNKTLPVIEHYRERNLLMEVDAAQGGVEQVFDTTAKIFEDLLRERLS